MNSGRWCEGNVNSNSNININIKGLTTEVTEGHREKR